MSQMSEKSVVWVTGASSGIGEALAYRLAKQGFHVAASARSAYKLLQMASGNYGAGSIRAFPLDVTDAEAIAEVVDRIRVEFGRIDIAVLNAGTYLPEDTVDLDVEMVRRQFDINVFSVLNCMSVLFPEMRTNGKGHIAIVSSVAGYRGLPHSAAYSATKAALIALAESLQSLYAQHKVKLQIINPGFVRTPLTAKNTFPMPFLITAEKAADIIARGLTSNRFEIVFPWPMAILMKIVRMLPYALFLPLTKLMRRAEKT